VTAADIAAALGATLGLGGEGLCFPCRTNKRPTTPHGFKEVTGDPNSLGDLLRRHPAGPLVGLATGDVSGIDGLDLYKGHLEASVWWAENRHRLPETQTHRTLYGGLHLLLSHTSALRYTAGRIAHGIDKCGDRGYPPLPYTETAVDRACRRIIGAPNGKQETPINAEAFSIGTPTGLSEGRS
jgi:hypothetical protein